MQRGGQRIGGKNRRNEVGISSLALNVRRYRKMRGLTMTDLANKVEVDYSQISRIERGVVNATVSMIFDIAKVLDVKPQQLIEEFPHL
ncbi:helix-turn-helix domain-containing protein [Pedobacter sp. BMA]|uniref:helix-turn-helix domain-containing protein n=1 Tax=Pedobacter sp. BMA TaxID=1663685 RepID=UPI000649B5A7|nr:helix-turn-helix transcriptional regulator [Pedobacter sp. BMA]KLT66476.1 hypothetical protein AB669_04610 [Pedobacter sp. BMA]